MLRITKRELMEFLGQTSMDLGRVKAEINRILPPGLARESSASHIDLTLDLLVMYVTEHVHEYAEPESGSVRVVSDAPIGGISR